MTMENFAPVPDLKFTIRDFRNESVLRPTANSTVIRGQAAGACLSRIPQPASRSPHPDRSPGRHFRRNVIVSRFGLASMAC
jgi:hypothetical protein